jgi:peptide/nickel transport system permease protein
MLSVPLLFVVSALVFLLQALVPGNITWTILGNPARSHVPPEQYQTLAHQLGVDRPLWAQYWNWLWPALHGDLGYSPIAHEAVTQAITQRFPVTLSLVLGSLLVSVVIGVLLGILSALRRGAVATGIASVSMIGWVLPSFWIAAELVAIFAVSLHWLPAVGYVSISDSPTQWLRSLVLPVAALSLAAIAYFAQYTREAMLDALGSEYVRMARAIGISPTSVVFRHALKTASLPIVTLANLMIVGLLAGTVFVEQVFALPGLGSLVVNATTTHDITVTEGVAVFFTLIIVAVNLVTDLVYGGLSPRVRSE